MLRRLVKNSFLFLPNPLKGKSVFCLPGKLRRIAAGQADAAGLPQLIRQPEKSVFVLRGRPRGGTGEQGLPV